MKKGGIYITALGIIITLIVGVLMLVIGAVTKKKWLMIISILPLVISIIQIIILFSI